MALATWWRGDHLPALTPLEDFFAGPTDHIELLARLAHLEVSEVCKRLEGGHRPYVAWLGGEAVAYGWVATHSAQVGELDLTIVLPQGNCYLWDFATLPDWRGRGIYPRLLQAILARESMLSERFWIIAASENRASSTGIVKAGFTRIAHLSFQRHGEPGLVAMVKDERMLAAAQLLQIAVIDAAADVALAPCWHCAMDAREKGRAVADVACWPDVVPAGTNDALALASCQCS
jgi:GNAT superfamily N-acetyltransferase